jgi:hypothetical protein
MCTLNGPRQRTSNSSQSFQWARILLAGQGYDKGAQPYQDFDLLMDIRNAIVHLKPEKMYSKTSPLMQRLMSKGICGETSLQQPSSLVSQVSTRAAARWACNVAVDMVESIGDTLPEGSLSRAFVQSYLRGSFLRVT